MIKCWLTTPTFICVVAIATGCSGSNNRVSAQPSPSDAIARASEPATAPVASQGTETTSAGTCPLVASDQVEQVMQLGIRSVEVRNHSRRCTFHFKGGDHGDLEVTYAAQGGRDELDSVRKAGQAAKAIFGGIAKAASAPPSVMGVISATAPPDVAKVGDDQDFVTEGPVTQFYALKGDAYVEVDGGFLPEGVSRWIALPEIAKRVLATR